jgi:putative ABC transport system substrate-binding protein
MTTTISRRKLARRTFMAGLGGLGLGGAALALPRLALAQRPARPMIGFLNSTAPDPGLGRVAAFRRGLQEVGYVERESVAIQYRWAENQTFQLPNMAAEFVRQGVDVLATTGGTAAALAAKRASSTIPIVFEIGGDPVAAGLVDDLGHPSGNLTGMTLNVSALAPKQFELVRELLPKAATVGVLINPSNPNTATVARLEAAARAVGLRPLVLNVTNEIGLDAPIANLVRERGDALIVSNDPFFFNWREKIVMLAARHMLPAVFMARGYAAAGGLISYGASLTDAYHQVGVYVGRILRGEKPSDLPVVQSSKFALVINLNTARGLGLEVPPALLARADEVIQ